VEYDQNHTHARPFRDASTEDERCCQRRTDDGRMSQ
jgi:hypothetical protein